MVKNIGENIATISSGFKNVSSQMGDFLAKSEHQPLALPTTGIPPNSSDASPDPSAPSSGTLVFTGQPLPQLDRAKYPKVTQWLPTDYNNNRKVGKSDAPMENGRKVSVLSSYMEDENGTLIHSSIRDAAREMTWKFCWLLLRNGMAPARWRDASLDVSNELTFRLETNFPWLRLCEGHWKAKKVVTNGYPQWYAEAIVRFKKEKAKALASQTLDAEVIDVDSDSDAHERPPKRHLAEGDDAGHSKRPRRVEEVPPSAQPAKSTTNRRRVCPYYHSSH